MDVFDLEKLLKKAKNGDSEAFALIYDHYKERLYRFIFFRVGHKELAEDILSDTFVKAWQKLSLINQTDSFNGWIYQVAKNNIIDYYRIKRITLSIEEVTETVSDSESPVDQANLTIEQKIMLELVERLVEEQRLVIQYKFFEDLTNNEIAAIMGKSEGAIRVIQHRAVKKLQQLLKKRIKL
jgi:RNA polymerase sigma-70 factor, ECF subfamily